MFVEDLRHETSPMLEAVAFSTPPPPLEHERERLEDKLMIHLHLRAERDTTLPHRGATTSSLA